MANCIKFDTLDTPLTPQKPINWRGSSLDDIRDDKIFSVAARREAGHQLNQIQAGLDPDDWKPFDLVGPGTREIRINLNDGCFRVMYVAKFPEAVYVLHCFRKKTAATSERDKEIARARYKAVILERTSR